MKDLPTEALTLISRARVLEKLIKDAMAETPERATLGELLRDNPDLFNGINEDVQWASKVRNGCAHVSDQDFSTVDIQRATEILDSAIAEMNGDVPAVDDGQSLNNFAQTSTPHIFTNSFYIDVFWFALLAGAILFLLMHF